MNKTELQQVLEALKSIVDWNSKSLDSGEDAGRGVTSMQLNKARDAIALCEADMARVDEPVAWIAPQGEGFRVHLGATKPEYAHLWEPLYATPKEAAAPGWKLVPIEPTNEMLVAWCDAHGSTEEHRPVWKLSVDRQAFYTYKAMLAAAPEPKP